MLPTVAVSPVGASGTVAGVAVTSADSAPSPSLLTARTLKAYAVPLARPVTVKPVALPSPGALLGMSVQSP